MSWLDITLLLLLALWLAASVRWMLHRRAQGKCLSCGGDCSKCTSACTQRK